MEFKTYKLSDVVKIIGGGTPKRNNPKYWGGNIDWLSVADFNNDFRFVKNSSEKITELGVKESSTRILKTGQVIISARGTVGCVAQLSKPMAFNQSCYGLQANDSLMNNDFLYYSLKNSIDDFKKKSHGGVFNTITRDTFKYIEISLPSLDRQRKIAKILGDLDDKIHLNHQINQTLEQIAQAIFKSWFVDFDPVKAKMDALAQGADKKTATISAMATISGQSQDELASLKANRPNDYQRLYDIADAFPSEIVDGVPLGWKRIAFKNFVSESKERVGDLQGVEEYSVGNTGIYPRSNKYSKKLSKSPEKNKLIKKGYIAFGMGSKTLNWGIMFDELGSVSPAYFVYKVDLEKVNYFYLNFFIKSYEYDYQSLIKPTSRQGQSVDKGQFLDKEIYIPDKYTLSLFLNILQLINKIIDSNKKEIECLSEIRDKLLPKLLSGEIEL